MLRMRPLVVAITSVTTIAMTVLLSAGPASAVTRNYVALGDSYSSGVGAGSYTTESGSCDRSTNAYSALWAKIHLPTSYRSVACSGATTTSVINTQLSALNSTTTLVSVTAGGNDIGFSNIMKTCVLYGTTECVAAVNAAETKARNNLPGLLNNLYNGIRSHAPNARVVVLDYPVFYDTSVSFCIGLSGTSRAKIDEGINLADGIIKTAAANHGFAFAEARTGFLGHEICDSTSWLHSLNYVDLGVSYHPTAAGQSGGYLPVFTSAAG